MVNLISKFPHKPPYRVSLRAQLTALVSIVAMVSLIILAITTGVYFTANYKNLRSDRLFIAAQLKSSQIDQTLNDLYYQCYYLASRDTLQTSLTNYVAGNKSDSNWASAQSVLEKFLSSSNIFSVVRIYDSAFNNVLNTTNNGTGDLIDPLVLEKLFPLSTNQALPSSLATKGLVTNPVVNVTNYIMSMSLPIFANPSIILSDSRVYGYMTIVMTANSMLNVFNDSSALMQSDVVILGGAYENGTLNGYKFIFSPGVPSEAVIDPIYVLKNDSFMSDALVNGKSGAIKSTKFMFDEKVALGYYPCSNDLVNWVAVVTQAESVFLSPSTRLAKIIAGVVVGIAVFVVCLTLPLSHWAVKPIVRMQKATESITEGRGLRPSTPTSLSRTSSFRRDRASLPPLKLTRRGDTPISKVILKSSSTDNDSILNEKFNDDKKDKDNDNDNNTNENKNSPTDSRDTDTLTSNNRYIPNNLSSLRQNPQSFTMYNDESYDISPSTKHKNYTTSTNLNGARVPYYRRLFFDELSDLTETFNTMTDALDQHYALLEERVRARTKQLEAAKIEAETANEAKTVFIANISHELRTPLNGILGMAAISMEETDIDRIRNSLKLIFRSGELLLHILTELLTFSKNVLQRTKLEKRNFCITDIALQIKSIFGKIARDQHVNLSILLSPNKMRSMVLHGDSNRIIQIVMNLVSNALKFTPDDGKVDVRVKLLGEYDEEQSASKNYTEVCLKQDTSFIFEEPSTKHVHDTHSGDHSAKTCSTCNDSFTEVSLKNDKSDMGSTMSSSMSSYDDAIFNSQFQKTANIYDDDDEGKGTPLDEPKTWVIQIEVQDTGPGIDETLQESVFEPFVQGDQTLSRQYGGTGLGLSICRQLATMMHGTMKLESTLGVGSKFTFTVPLTQVKELDMDNESFEDEFNEQSKKNRKVKFKSATSLHSHKSRLSLRSPKNGNDVESHSREDSNKTSVNLGRPFLQSTGTATSISKVLKIESLTTTDETNENNTNTDVTDKFNETKPDQGTETNPNNLDERDKPKNIKILVAEDNHVNQQVIKRMLELENINDIHLARDGQEAFDQVKDLQENHNEHYTIIFMDVQMPNVDGLLATKMIRQNLHYTFPIVALTAFADDSNIKECLDAGMDGFLSKPIKRPKLKTIIQEFSQC